MIIKKFLCLNLCLALFLLTVACRQSDGAFSSAYTSSTVSVSQGDENSKTNDSSTQSDTSSGKDEESSSAQSDTSSGKDKENSSTQSDTSSGKDKENSSAQSNASSGKNEENSSAQSNSSEVKDEENSSSTDSSSNESVDMEATYGFNSIKNVTYSCKKNIPNYDVVYEITEILTDKGQDVSIYTDIICKEKSVTVDGKNITMPYSFCKNNDSLKLTARHRASGAEYNFKINIKADQWNVSFEEEFEGDTLNTDLWGDIWDTDNEYEWRDNFSFAYKKDNVFVDGKGNLINRVVALDEKNSAGNPVYTSSMISTKDCFESDYGYYEMRVIPHRATGMWGAWWILAGDMDSEDAKADYSSKNGVEIDIFETLYDLGTARHALFWDGYYNGQTQGKTYNQPEIPNLFDGDYHLFGLKWTPEEFIFYVDGEETWRLDGAGGCEEPGYMLISSHFNTSTGDITLKPGEHSDMIIDYIKIYTNDSYSK